MRLSVQSIVFFTLAYTSSGWAIEVDNCPDDATDIPIVAKAYSEGVQACKYPDGWHLLNNAGEQVTIGKDGQVCVLIAGKGNQLCCPQTNTGTTVQSKNGRYENKKGSRFECKKDSQGQDEKALLISRIDENGNIVSGSDTFTVTGTLDDATSGGRPNQDRHTTMTVTQTQGGTGSGATPKEGKLTLDLKLGSAGPGTGDSSCDDSKKCKTSNLIEKDIAVDPTKHQYVDNNSGKSLVSDRTGEQKYSFDALH